MNINELNTIADNIRSVDDNTHNADVRSILEYGVRKRNECVDILKSVYDFLLANADLFENPKGGWLEKTRNREYYVNSYIGTANRYNCVIRDADHWSKDWNIYWVDEGIIFKMSKDLKRIAYVTDCDQTSRHGYGENAHDWNDSGDFTKFNHPLKVRDDEKGEVCDGGQFSRGEVLWDESRWDIEQLTKGEWDEFKAVSMKKMVDEDFAHAERIMDRLVYSLKRISESVTERQSRLNEALDDSHGKKVSKYTIEITKIEE